MSELDVGAEWLFGSGSILASLRPVAYAVPRRGL